MVFTLLLALVGWFVVRDFMAGVLLRLEETVAQDERIQVQQMKGRITKMGHFSLVFETDEGQIVRVPYRKVHAEIQVKDHPARKIKKHQFRVAVPKDTSLEVAEKRIRLLLYTAPWSSILKTPQVQLFSETETHYDLRIIAYTLQVAHFHKVQQYLQKHYKGAALSVETLD